MTGNDESFSAADAPMLLAASRRALLMYRISEREQQIAEVILQWSFARGRAEALVPELLFFKLLTGIDESDVRKALNRMTDKAIVQVKELGRDDRGRKLRSYRFRPFAAWWKDAPCRVDVTEALAAADELDRVNALGRDVDPDGQARLFAAADDDFDDGLSAASRDEVLKDAAPVPAGDAHPQDAARPVRDAQSKVPAASRADGPRLPSTAGTRMGDPPTQRPMGKPPSAGAMGDSPTGSQTRARARVVQHVQYGSTQHVQNVASAAGKPRRFADSEKQCAMEAIESLCAQSKGFRRYWWVSKVRDLPATVILTAIGDTKTYLQTNRCREEPGAVLWCRVQELATPHPPGR